MAQEAGLVLVIALLMAMLSIFSKPITQRDFERADDNTKITESAGVFSATIKNEPRTFAAADGWELKGAEGNQSLQRTRNVNKFLNLQNLVQLLVNASFIAIMAVAITAVIAMGGIDLSIGSIYALAALMVALVIRYLGPQGAAWPNPTMFGSSVVWFMAIVVGVVGVSIPLWGRRRQAGSPVPTSGGGVWKYGIAAISLLSLTITGWILVRAMRDGWTGPRDLSAPFTGYWPVPKIFGAGWIIAFVVAAVMLFVGLVSLRSAAATNRTRAGMLSATGLIALGILAFDMFAAIREPLGNGQTLGPLLTLPLAMVVALIVGGLCGLLNGTMIVGLRVHPFIITLGTMAAYRGLCTLPTKSQSVANMSPSFQDFLTFDVNGVTPVPVGIMLIIALIGFVLLGYTVLGRQVYAIGGNEVAAKYAGIPVGKVKIIVYTIMGMMAGLAGFLYVGYYGAAEPAAGTGYELSVIAAAVIGGASLSGGRGSPTGAVLGAILVQLIDNSLVILDIDQSYKQIVIGGAIVGAVVLDQLKSRLMPMGR